MEEQTEKTMLTARNIILIIIFLIVNFLFYINYKGLNFILFLIGEISGILLIMLLKEKTKNLNIVKDSL